MPYNISAIPPPEEVSGHAALPLTRIKKIIHLDEDIAQCSNNAAFVIAVATEMFIRYLAEQGYNVVKSERKPRRTIQYKDLATAVSRIDNLEFLADVIPKTTTYKQFKEKRAKETANGAGFLPRSWVLDEVIQRVENKGDRKILDRIIHMALNPFQDGWDLNKDEEERFCGDVPRVPQWTNQRPRDWAPIPREFPTIKKTSLTLSQLQLQLHSSQHSTIRATTPPPQ
ncbi:hypothetical protein PAAG_11466 [Paracoccidioides lutzii Pb01]|uniref:Transcription factor CBF/NF-Y/archaeal histone domain-containing protein n=1 Tax=Paracoccidioides lutzii (strain ATCC MYA-826 / Pb01) TaxID=502779 RepID=A0A0A2V2Q3_PARBA|nr:hypothetical protein PAAG_11466 [Paracoccidioides lutzii Pb01]KGQ01748.1 hypothetical protein PAAG_11466 [Paracoccidioides lutzii Pb01]